MIITMISPSITYPGKSPDPRGIEVSKLDLKKMFNLVKSLLELR
jgi:hypothetical protein